MREKTWPPLSLGWCSARDRYTKQQRSRIQNCFWPSISETATRRQTVDVLPSRLNCIQSVASWMKRSVNQGWGFYVYLAAQEHFWINKDINTLSIFTAGVCTGSLSASVRLSAGCKRFVFRMIVSFVFNSFLSSVAPLVGRCLCTRLLGGNKHKVWTCRLRLLLVCRYRMRFHMWKLQLRFGCLNTLFSSARLVLTSVRVGVDKAEVKGKIHQKNV